MDTKTKQQIISAIRQINYRSKERREALKKAESGLGYKCALCQKDYRKDQIRVDHVLPAAPINSALFDWTSFINGLFCDVSNLQIVCKSCHQKKTNQENKLRRKLNNART